MSGGADFTEIAAALKLAAESAALTAENCEQLVAKLPVECFGIRHDLEKIKARARALGRGHRIFEALVRYEPETLRLIGMSRKYAGRRRLFSRRNKKGS